MRCLRRSIKSNSPIRLFVLLLSSIFFGEILIMWVLKWLQPLTFLHSALLDAILVMIIMFPSLFYFLFRPLMRQIGERKMVEEIIKKSEERYRSMFENIQDVYYEVNIDGIIIEISPSVHFMSQGQYSRRDLLGSSVYDLYVRPSERDEILLLLKKNEQLRDYEVTLKNKDGSLFNCSISARICYDAQQNPKKIVGSMRDISKRKRVEEEIRLKNNQLRLINSEKDKLFSIISHDLRSPLSAFIGLTEMMAASNHSFSPDEMKMFAGTIHNSATNLYGLLENLLLWSGTKHGTLSFKLRNLQLLTLVKDSIITLNEVAENKNIEIICNIPADMMVYADANAFQTIVRNLTSNALKFTTKGGKITLSARSMPGNKTEIEVKDTGIGMDQEMLDKLFSIDSKINRPGTEGEPSTGLGLLLCKEFVEKHGGTIEVKSTVGQGSRFYFVV